MRKIFGLAGLAALVACGPAKAPPAPPSSGDIYTPATYSDLPPAPTTACLDEADTFCEGDMKGFAEQWPRAWAGDYQSQRNVAFMQSARTAGVQYNPVQGCAWRMVIMASGHPQFDSTDTSNYNIECNHLDAGEFIAAEASARTIFKKIKGGELPEMPKPTGKLGPTH